MVALWLTFGSPFDSLWGPFGSRWPPFGSLCVPFRSLLLPLATLLHPSAHFSYLWMPFRSILLPIFLKKHNFVPPDSAQHLQKKPKEPFFRIASKMRLGTFECYNLCPVMLMHDFCFPASSLQLYQEEILGWGGSGAHINSESP